MNIGTVYLVGAGPGDPGLITVRGREIVRTADVVVYDRLAHPAIVAEARPDAEKIYVGKVSAAHAMKQPDINALLIERAKQGKKICRLKGGDPFVFGRGGEEAEECHAAGVPFEVVPGVTSAIAAPAYAGIPVTHRDAASSFAIVTGHERDDNRESGTRAPGAAEGRRNWANISRAADTLIFLMGVEALPEISARLQENGRAPETPVALVQWGTWTKQRVVTGTLANIVEVVREAKLTPPAVCVVGEVVRLRETLAWFDNVQSRPLFGKRVLVTRAREQASALSDLLRSRGAEPVEFPVIKIVRTENTEPLDIALRNLASYDWLVFTSANAVPVVAERLEALSLDTRAFGKAKIAAIGPATAEALRNRLNLRADYVPSEAVAESVVAEWPDMQMQGKKVLIPRASEARDILPENLKRLGASVEVLPVYTTVSDASESETMREQLLAGELDVLTFSSSSTVRNFVEAICGEDTSGLKERFKGVVLAAIGPITADTLREFGLEPQIVSGTHTIPAMVAAIETYFDASPVGVA